MNGIHKFTSADSLWLWWDWVCIIYIFVCFTADTLKSLLSAKKLTFWLLYGRSTCQPTVQFQQCLYYSLILYCDFPYFRKINKWKNTDISGNVGLINLKQLIQRHTSLDVPKTDILQTVLSYVKKRNKMNQYVRNAKIYQLIEVIIVNLCSVSKLDLRQQVLILTLLNF